MSDVQEVQDDTNTTVEDDRHVDINVMFMSRSELRDYEMSLRPSMNDFLKSNEEKYKQK